MPQHPAVKFDELVRFEERTILLEEIVRRSRGKQRQKHRRRLWDRYTRTYQVYAERAKQARYGYW